MRSCLQKFLSCCTVEQRMSLLLQPRRELRPLAPKPAEPAGSSTSAEADQTAGAGPTQQYPPAKPLRKPALRRSRRAKPLKKPTIQHPHPAEPLKKPTTQPPQPTSPAQQRSEPTELAPQTQTGKRKREGSASVISITSESDDESSDSSADAESERATPRRRTTPSQLQRETPSEGTAFINPEIRLKYFKGLSISKIEEALQAFDPVGSCETLQLPPLQDMGLNQAFERPPSPVEAERESRMRRHVETIKSFISKSGDIRKTMVIYDRIHVLLIQFEVDMLRTTEDLSGIKRSTRQSSAITKFAQLCDETESWVKDHLRKANKYMLLSEEHPSYLTELKHNRASK